MLTCKSRINYCRGMSISKRINLRNINQPIMVKKVQALKPEKSKNPEKVRLGKLSRNKGKAGEREVAKLFTVRNFPSKRGVQYNGSTGSPDVIIDALSEVFQIEVKRTETFNLYSALTQAKSDAPTKVPLVIHRRSKRPWVAVIELNRLIDLFQIIFDRVDWANDLASELNDGEGLL